MLSKAIENFQVTRVLQTRMDAIYKGQNVFRQSNLTGSTSSYAWTNPPFDKVDCNMPQKSTYQTFYARHSPVHTAHAAIPRVESAQSPFGWGFDIRSSSFEMPESMLYLIVYGLFLWPCFNISLLKLLASDAPELLMIVSSETNEGHAYLRALQDLPS